MAMLGAEPVVPTSTDWQLTISTVETTSPKMSADFLQLSIQIALTRAPILIVDPSHL